MQILIVGSVNMDVVVRVDHVPGPGENVRCNDLATIPGGKGANQAVACARMGAGVNFLGRVGDDEFGRRLRTSLQEVGVGVEALQTVAGATSGVALILVSAKGEASLIITPGANGRLGAADVLAARPLFDQADAVLVQLEIPAEAVAAAIRLGREAGKPVIVDAGPPRLPIETAVFEATILTPNEAEAAALLGVAPGSQRPEELAAELWALGPQAVVLKAGAYGAVVADGKRLLHVPGFRIDPVDTTAAGDAFTAALTVAILEGADLAHAAQTANAAGALACLKLGAQPSLPTAGEVAAFLAAHT